MYVGIEASNIEITVGQYYQNLVLAMELAQVSTQFIVVKPVYISVLLPWLFRLMRAISFLLSRFPMLARPLIASSEKS